MLTLAIRGGTTWEPLVNIFLAKQVNQALGGPFVSPWEVGQLDDNWIEIIRSSATDLMPMRKGLQEIEQIKERIRRSHPTYSKRRVH